MGGSVFARRTEPEAVGSGLGSGVAIGWLVVLVVVVVFEVTVVVETFEASSLCWVSRPDRPGEAIVGNESKPPLELRGLTIQPSLNNASRKRRTVFTLGTSYEAELRLPHEKASRTRKT